MNSARRYVLGAVIAICLLVGCGGGTSGTGGFTTGLDKSRELRTLKPAEIDAICRKYGSYVQDVFSAPLLCPALSRIVAESNSEDFTDPVVVQCRELDQNCRESIEVDDTIECTLSEVVAGCAIDIDTLETCYNDTFGQLEDGFSQISCENDRNKPAEDLVLSILSRGIASSPACDSFLAMCPEAIKRLNP